MSGSVCMPSLVVPSRSRRASPPGLRAARWRPAPRIDAQSDRPFFVGCATAYFAAAGVDPPV